MDAAQGAALGRWWAHALGWVVTFEADDELEIRPNPERRSGGAALGRVADPEGNEFCVLAPRGSQPTSTELVAGVS